MSKRVFSLLVDNQAGVLSRVAGLFSRRGYNIDSLTVGETENPAYSRMTIVTSGEPEILEQIEKQLLKLVDVLEIKVLPAGESVCKELIYVKVATTADTRQQVIAIADIFHAKVVDVTAESLMMEVTGQEGKINSFIELVSPYGILELARTGVTGLARG
ncbi:MAG: acetolactate synthase small subunit [Lachnospiraceae bacterium]|nr:acetolactate synthase small subunit [Lachnospiraceae bacterium]